MILLQASRNVSLISPLLASVSVPQVPPIKSNTPSCRSSMTRALMATDSRMRVIPASSHSCRQSSTAFSCVSLSRNFANGCSPEKCLQADVCLRHGELGGGTKTLWEYASILRNHFGHGAFFGDAYGSLSIFFQSYITDLSSHSPTPPALVEPASMPLQAQSLSLPCPFFNSAFSNKEHSCHVTPHPSKA